MRLFRAIFIAIVVSVLSSGATLSAENSQANGIPPGRYVGTYTCAQRVIPVSVEIDDLPSGGRSGRFDFGDEKSPAGSYTIAVKDNPAGGFVLSPVGWIQRPAGYVMVGVSVKLDGDRLVGRPNHPSCKEFNAGKVENGTSPAAVAQTSNIAGTQQGESKRIEAKKDSDRRLAAARAEAMEKEARELAAMKPGTDTMRKELESAIKSDSKNWAMNKFNPGSVRDVKIKRVESTHEVVRGTYTFNGNQQGWVEAEFKRDRITCLRFWDKSQCMPVTYEREFSETEALAEAEAGNVVQQIFLGTFYAAKEKYAEANKWLRKAAEAGSPGSAYMLGVSYEKGKVVAQDYAEAAIWFRKAADGGLSLAQVRLGGMYVLGKGVEKNAKESVKWFRSAAQSGDADGQFFLGNAYANGAGVAKDEAEAVKWFRKAAAQGNKDAVVQLEKLGELP